MSNTAQLITPSPIGLIADITELFEKTFAHFSRTLKVNADDIPEETMSSILGQVLIISLR